MANQYAVNKGEILGVNSSGESRRIKVTDDGNIIISETLVINTEDINLNVTELITALGEVKDAVLAGNTLLADVKTLVTAGNALLTDIKTNTTPA